MRKHLRRLHFVREVPYPRGDGLALVLSLHAAEHRLEQVTRVYPPALALFQHAAIRAEHPAAPGLMRQCFSGAMLTGPLASREGGPVHRSASLPVFRS